MNIYKSLYKEQSYNSKIMKIKNTILDDLIDQRYVSSPTSEIDKETDDEYCSGN